MSYILDALRKSETERRQGRVPELGQQVQMIHKPKKKAVPVLVWVVTIALVLNAVILAWVFWPRASVTATREVPATSSTDTVAPVPQAEPIASAPEPVLSGSESSIQSLPAPAATPATPDNTLANAVEIPMPGTVEPTVEEMERERPTVIVPSPREPSAVNPSSAADDGAAAARTPHLVELPLSFQKRVPDLIFNSHIYASEPSSRRVMINDNYLRPGESFSGITVERITEEGVELSMDGRRFRVGVVRNWVSPR
ncbi:MAG: general secretion pathway protein GspB [Marinobacter sp.]|uniref:general secretion pathway protein GspB n=1 Tax=Marinobacter sp. TaxID=50741 RepID=UPI00329689D7